MKLIIPFEVIECSKCGAYNLPNEDVCTECGERLEVQNDT